MIIIDNKTLTTTNTEYYYYYTYHSINNYGEENETFSLHLRNYGETFVADLETKEQSITKETIYSSCNMRN